MPGDVVRIRDQRWRVARHTRYGDEGVLAVLGCEASNRGVRTCFLLRAERIQPMPAVTTVRVVRPPRWRHAARAALAGSVPRVESLRAAADAGLDVIPFQLEPVLALTHALGRRMLIADDVGLGKTIQAGLVVAETLVRTPDAHVLIVAPAALRDQWQQELERRFRIRAAVLDAAGVARAALLAGPGANPWATSSVVVTSIDYVKRPEVIRGLEGLVWDAVLFDEAHWLAGPSERSAAARSLARRARLVLLLSATPHPGDDAAFARLCGTGELPGDPPLLLFRRTRQDAGLETRRRTCWLRVHQTPAEAALHRALMTYARLVWDGTHPGARGARLAVSVLVKRACSSAASAARSLQRRLDLLTELRLPTDVQLPLPLETSAPEGDDEPLAVLGAPGLQDGADECRRLRELLALAWTAAGNESKLRALDRLVRRSRRPLIVFTEYRDTLAGIAAALDVSDAVHLHGGITLAERREALRQFAAGSARLLLATDAASEGLNLHHRCHLVVNIELPWSPLRLAQRVGRVDRIGQRARVHAVHLIAGGTEEENTVGRLLQRAARARDALSGQAAVWDEARTASIVMSGSPDAPLSGLARSGGPLDPGPARPALFVTPDLRARAREEAARIVASRSLGRRGGIPDEESRPVATSIRRRNGRAAPLCYWAFRVAFLDTNGQVAWSTLLGARADIQEGGDGPGGDALALLSDGDRSGVDAAVHRHQRTMRAAVRAAIVRTSTLAATRERAIRDDLLRNHARLAALQPGLFDRRSDRAAAEQRAVLDAALERCRLRLAELDGVCDLSDGTRELVFAARIA